MILVKKSCLSDVRLNMNQRECTILNEAKVTSQSLETYSESKDFCIDFVEPDFPIGIIIPCLTWPPSSSHEMALSWPQSASRSERASKGVRWVSALKSLLSLQS